MGNTYNALRRAESKFQRRSIQKKSLSKNAELASLEKLESQLIALRIGRGQISKQSLKDLKQSLHRINGCIASPESFLKFKFRDKVNSETDFKINVVPILVERKKLMLERFDELVNASKIKKIRQLIKEITDTSVRTSIEKILDELQTKNSILKREYQKLENIQLNINYEKQK